MVPTNSAEEYVIGFDIGGTNVRGFLYKVINDENGKLANFEEVHSIKRALRVDKGKKLSLGVLRDTEERLIKLAKTKYNVRQINAGFAPPGPMNIKEGWTQPSNIKCWGRYPILQDARDRGVNEARMENDVNSQTIWFANLPEYRRFKRIFLGNPGTGYGGGVTSRLKLDEIVFAQEGVEVGWLNDFGLRYGFRNGDITSEVSGADEVIDERPILARSRRKSVKVSKSCEDAACSGRGLYRILFDVLGGAESKKVSAAINQAVVHKGMYIAKYAHQGDKNCIKAMQIQGYHFGHSLFQIDKLSSIDKFIWYGNTAEKDWEIMQNAVIEGYASNFINKEGARAEIREKLDVITAEKIANNPQYKDAGAKGAALLASQAGLESEKKEQEFRERHRMRDGKIYFDLSSGEAAFIYGFEGMPHRFVGTDIGSMAYSGCNSEDWEKGKYTYGDFFRDGVTEPSTRRAMGNALADLMVWYYPHEPKEVVITGVSKGEWAGIKDDIWKACCDNHRFAKKGMQFRDISLKHIEGNLSGFYIEGAAIELRNSKNEPLTRT